MTETMNRKAHLRVGGAAVAVFVALLLAGAARGQGPVEPGVPAVATPTPDPITPAPGERDRGFRGGPRERGGFGGPRRGGGGMPGGGAAPGGSAPAPAPDTGSGGTT